jgi:glucokinase
MGKNNVSIGVDVGGTYTKIAILGKNEKILAKKQVPTQSSLGPKDFVSRISGAVMEMEKLLKVHAEGFGLALAGAVDPASGKILFAPNLKGWPNFDFKKAFSKKMGARKFIVENDANAAVWGCYVLDFKKKGENFLGLTLGTGVGGGIVCYGKLYRGSAGSAGEIGHMRVAVGGELCHCGSRGCLEAYAGGYGIIKTARRMLSESPDKGRILSSLCADPNALEPRHLSEAAQMGDVLSQEVWAVTARYLAAGIASLVMIFNPDGISLLGGVSAAGRHLMDPLKKELSQEPFKLPFSRAKIRMTENSDFGCIGAALLALQ